MVTQKERDELEAKESLVRLYKRGHPGKSDSEALKMVEEFLESSREPKTILRERWERLRSDDPTPDLTPSQRRIISGTVRYAIPPKPLVQPEKISKDEQIAALLERIEELTALVEEQRSIIKAYERERK